MQLYFLNEIDVSLRHHHREKSCQKTIDTQIWSVKQSGIRFGPRLPSLSCLLSLVTVFTSRLFITDRLLPSLKWPVSHNTGHFAYIKMSILPLFINFKGAYTKSYQSKGWKYDHQRSSLRNGDRPQDRFCNPRTYGTDFLFLLKELCGSIRCKTT